MSDWTKWYDAFFAAFFSMAIGIITGFGWLFIEVSYLNNPVLESLFGSYLIGAGFSVIYALTVSQNLRDRYNENNEEDQ